MRPWIASLALAASCSSAPAPEPEPPPAAKPEVRYAEPAETEVVKLPWEGEVIERQEFCRPPREPLLDTTTSVFERVEIREGGLELVERGYYREGPATRVEVHGAGCTHDTVTITFAVTDQTAPGDVEHYRRLAVELLRALPIKGEPPNYASILADVLATGKPDPETPNLIVGGTDAIVTFDVEPAGAGTVTLSARYDFPL